MVAPAVLVVYAVLMSTVAARRLEMAEWPQRAPRLGIWTWQALTASVVLAVLLVGTTLAMPTLPGVTDLATWVDACVEALRAHYLTPGGAALSVVGLGLVVLVAGRLGWVLAGRCWGAARRRAEQHQALLLVARRDGATRALVVTHPTPAAYCVPGRRGTVVFTSAALAVLGPGQAAAVLAHERAHLRGRHHLVLTAADALRAAFPFVPAFTTAQAQLAQLVEMRADDVALSSCEPRVLATALLALAGGPAPAGTVGAGGTTAAARAHRLTRPARPLGWPRSALTTATAVVLIVLPVLIAAGPGVVAVVVDLCPLGFPPY